MNTQMLSETQLQFVAVKPNRFVIGGKGYSELEVFIEDIMPVRKFFQGKKLVCYSSDGKTGKTGKSCPLCRDRFKCRRRMRLMIMVRNIADEPVPALLEINPQSFDHLNEFLESVEKDKISSTMVRLAVGKNEQAALTVQFAAIF